MERSLRTEVDGLTSHFRKKLDKVWEVSTHELGANDEILSIVGRDELRAEKFSLANNTES